MRGAAHDGALESGEGPAADPAAAEILDRYVAALQAGDAREQDRLGRAHPRLGEWAACLGDLDLLASGLEDNPAAAVAAVPTGTRFGPYEILGEIGRGGMGVVYRARQSGLGRDVALKILAGGTHASDDQRRRFLAEARMAARIRHPRIVVIHDAGEHQGQLYYCMDLVVGEDLGARLARGPLPLAVAVQLVADVARAVDHLHAAGVLHRDLKPRNILLDGADRPFITDFGLARDDSADGDPTATGTVLGTPAYMAPEQACGGGAVDARCDVYALGAILYELLAGRPPFTGRTRLATLLQVLERDAVSPRRWNRRLPADLAGLCLRCLDKSPDRRPPSAAVLADDLEAFLRGERLQAGRGDAWHRFVRLVRRHPAAGFRLIGICGTAAVIIGRCLADPAAVGFYTPVLAGLAVWGMLAVVWERLAACGQAPRGTGCAEHGVGDHGGAPGGQGPGMDFIHGQPGIGRTDGATGARLFALTDGVMVSSLLWLVDGANGPLVAVYPLLVCAAGLWLEPGVVRLATVVALVGYMAVLVARPAEVAWHVAAIVGLLTVCAAGITELQIGRLRLWNR